MGVRRFFENHGRQAAPLTRRGFYLRATPFFIDRQMVSRVRPRSSHASSLL
jgi:hypothetical protein